MDENKEKKAQPLTLVSDDIQGGSPSNVSHHVRQTFRHGKSKSVAVEFTRSRPGAKKVGAGDRHGGNSSVLTSAEQQARRRALQAAMSATSAKTSDYATGDSSLKVAVAVNVEYIRPHDVVATMDDESSQATHRGQAGQAAPTAQARQKAQIGQEGQTGQEVPTSFTAADANKHKKLNPEQSWGGQKKKSDEDSWKSHGRKKTADIGKRSRKTNNSADYIPDDSSDYLTDSGETRSFMGLKKLRSGKKTRQSKTDVSNSFAKIVRDVAITAEISIRDLAGRMSESASSVIKILMQMGIAPNLQQYIDADTAELVVSELGHNPIRVDLIDQEAAILNESDAEEDMIPRPPVVTVMGHVDHGKTSLLDALHSTDIASQEAGGITQHIGAYQVTLRSGAKITFFDTPGHEAFSDMRARGANATDIVVLVVAADDGVAPQTIEAIKHAQTADVPIIVAVNKIDKPGANPERVVNELLAHSIVAESLGGQTIFVNISAKMKLNIDKLEEAILLQAEILGLRANPRRPAQGLVIESKIDKGRGVIATILIQRGTVNIGDMFVCGSEYSKVRAILDDKGRKIAQAGPSTPVEILGFSSSASAGDRFLVINDEVQARAMIAKRQSNNSDIESRKNAREVLSIHDLAHRQQLDLARKDLNVIIKTDVHGSLEALASALDRLSTTEVRVKVIHKAVGDITESDVVLAQVSSAIVIGFNVKANNQAQIAAQKEGIEIRYYSVIYSVVDDMKVLLGGMLSPIKKEVQLGEAQVRVIFNVSKLGNICGCLVTSGVIKQGCGVRLLRDAAVIHQATIKSLRREKHEAKEVRSGYECGILLDGYNDVKIGDVIECFEVENISRAIQ